MRNALFFITCLCLFYLKCVVGVENVGNSKLNSYLNKKSRATEDIIIEQLKTVIGRFEIEENARSSYFSGTYISVFSLFNEMFVLLDDKLFKVLPNDGAIDVKEIYKFPVKSNIKFAKMTQFKDIGFILIKTEMEIEVYGFQANEIFFIHSIFAPYASDMHFFVSKDSLYLIVVNNQGYNLAMSMVYKWLGSHFDESESIFTIGAIKVISFTNNFSEIIIILQYFPRRNLLSTVYEYKFGKLKKIQHLKTSEPIYQEVYQNKLGKYVLVFQKLGNNLVYAWDGSKLVKISEFRTETIVDKSAILTINETSVIAVPQKSQIQAFRLMSNKMKLIGEKSTNYLNILDILTEANTIYVVGLHQNNTFYVSTMSANAHVTDQQIDVTNKSLRNCFATLEAILYNRRQKFKKLNPILGQVKVGAVKKSTDSVALSTSTAENVSDPEDNLTNLRTRLERVQHFLNSYQGNDNNTVIDKKVIIKGSIDAEKLTGKKVHFKKVNGQNWTPNNWLRYKPPQNITGPVIANKIVVKELNTASKDHLFTELLTKNGNQDILGRFEIRNLTVNEIITKQLNDIELENIYLKSTLQPIQGLKTFENLNTTTAKINKLNGESSNRTLSRLNTHSLPRNAVYENNLEVENLVVDTIDDIQWNTFRDSVFRMGITKEINGNLTFDEFKSNNITLKTLKGVKIEDLLTSTTDQVIDADIEFVRIFAENITTNTTNDMKLSESAVQFDNNTFVKGPVKFDKLYVSGSLELVGELDKDLFLKQGEHIIGTNESDLWQNYEGTVKVRGNLYVKNLTIQQDAQLLVAHEKFDPNITNTYWTKTTQQVIPTHFEAQNGLTVPHLLLNRLNNIRFNQYMLNTDADRFETSYHFANISIAGDVFLDSRAKHTPNLTKLNEEAVKTTGSYYISGMKSYTSTFRTENLVATILNGVFVNETLTTNSVVNVTGKKTFKNIIIKGNLSCGVESVEFINGVNISHLLENAIYIDKPQNIEKMHFKNITVKDLWVTNLNSHKVNRHIENIQKILASNKINRLTINGGVTMENITGVSKINKIQFEDLLNMTWKQGKFGGILTNLKFLEPLKVDNLITANINTIDLRNLIKRLLYRGIEQNITATYTFKNIKTENLIVSKIRNVSMENLIEVTSNVPQIIYAPGGIELNSVILKYLKTTSTSPCDLAAALKKIIDPPSLKWLNVTIKGDANVLDPNNILYRIFEKAVMTNTKNIIQAPVQFSSHVMAENIFTKGHINGMNLQEIIDDAVLADSEDEQVITGHKIFPTMTISEAAVLKDVDIPLVNDVNIQSLDETIVRKRDVHNFVIKGKKSFYGGLQCDQFYSEKVSNIDVDNIVTTENLRKIPKAIFDIVEVVNNLNISHVNNFDFDRFLKSRLLTQGMDEQEISGIYFFNNVQITNIKTPSINNITMDNVVFDIGQQNISTTKRFSKPVEIFGNLACPYINGINLTEIRQESIGRDSDNITGSLTIARPSIVKGSITAEYINGFPIQQVKEILKQGAIRSETKKIHQIKNNIAERIKSNLNHIKFLASDYMYLEKTQALQISVPNTISAKTMESNGYVLIHVDAEESGETCGLHESCKCPVQYSIEVSPEHSVAIFPNKGFQRIFTYNDDGMIFHFLTNSFSMDSNCRTNSSKVLNEVSMMTWNTVQNTNNTGSFHHYDQYVTGYISGAEFFTLHGQTYAIIGRYYDPITDSHDLNCYVIKFSHDKSKAEKIQEIPTKGAWSVNLFHTAQGIILIIGNIKTIKGHHEEETQIYRFMEHTQKFDLLRIVPSYGCSLATGVVLGTDSLIVLAHRFAPLQVLKYNPEVDNYYFYQSFELDAPVIGISVFYTGGFGISDAYLCTVTANENYFIYSFRFIEGWKLESSGEFEGLRNLIPFELNGQSYLFAQSSQISSLLTVVKHGSV